MRFLTAATAWLLLLTACATTVNPENWPARAPDWQRFADAYERDAENRAHQTRDEYLLWIRRFYEGRPGVVGWLDTTEILMEDLAPAQQPLVRDTARQLGQRIAAEWARDNAVRRIDTAMLSLWGSIMVASPTPEDRVAAMRAIDRDTRALLSGDLNAQQITEERYAEFDSFF